jgi:hypothetical protein
MAQARRRAGDFTGFVVFVALGADVFFAGARVFFGGSPGFKGLNLCILTPGGMISTFEPLYPYSDRSLSS